MAGIYPSLHEKFKNEDICPICIMTMGQSPKYSCVNGHTVCHRCKPYYYACPTCQSPLALEVRPVNDEGYHMPPPMHYMPHPYPPQHPPGMPTAPFMDQERYNWAPPSPTEEQELKHCGFCHAGCEARFPEHLRQIHETRCQFRPNLEEKQLPTDLNHDEGSLLDCQYQFVGCNVRLPLWRKKIHEEICIYKDRLEGIQGIEDSFDQLSFQDDDGYGDPNELVECRFRRHGCMVRMPRRRKNIHEEKCNYHTDEDDEYGDPNELVECRFSTHGCQVRMPRRRKNTHEQKCNYRTDEDNYDQDQYSEPEQDPDEKVPCIWAENGCQVMPRACRKQTHEEKCNYRMEPCAYRDYGCGAMLQPPRKHLHETSCEYASYS